MFESEYGLLDVCLLLGGEWFGLLVAIKIHRAGHAEIFVGLGARERHPNCGGAEIAAALINVRLKTS